MVVVYRGKHCPLCTKYLAKIAEVKNDFLAAGVDIVAVSADTQEKAQAQALDKLGLSFEVGYNLSIEQMKELGVYISHPRSPRGSHLPSSHLCGQSAPPPFHATKHFVPVQA